MTDNDKNKTARIEDNSNMKLRKVLENYEGANLAPIVPEERAPKGAPSITVAWKKGSARIYGNRVGDRHGRNMNGLKGFGIPVCVVLNPVDFNSAEEVLRKLELIEAKIFDMGWENTSGPERVDKFNRLEAQAAELRAQHRADYGSRGGANPDERDLWWALLDGDVVPERKKNGTYIVYWRGCAYEVYPTCLYQFVAEEFDEYYRKVRYVFHQGNYKRVDMPSYFPRWEAPTQA